MTSARVVALALLVAAGSVWGVHAQAPEPGKQAPGPGKSATPEAEPWALPAELLSRPPNAPSYECIIQFKELRSQVEKEGMAARAGAEKRLSRAEICKLVRAYSTAESKWGQFAEMNVTKCGIPHSIVNQMKTVHGTTVQGQTKLCAAGLEPGNLRENPGYRFGPPTQPNDFPLKSLPRVSGR